MNDAYAMARAAWQEQAARQDREIADLRARLAAAEKLNEEARANGLADMIAQRNAALRKLAAAETRASMARLDDSQRDELAACKLALAVAEKERDEARASAPEMYTHLAERLKAHAREEAESERDEARAELVTVEHQRDVYRAERDEARALAAKAEDGFRLLMKRYEEDTKSMLTRAERAEALAAMRGEALRGVAFLFDDRPTIKVAEQRVAAHLRAALSGDAGEWLAAERKRVAEAVAERLVDHLAGIPGNENVVLTYDLSALLEKLP